MLLRSPSSTTRDTCAGLRHPHHSAQAWHTPAVLAAAPTALTCDAPPAVPAEGHWFAPGPYCQPHTHCLFRASVAPPFTWRLCHQAHPFQVLPPRMASAVAHIAGADRNADGAPAWGRVLLHIWRCCQRQAVLLLCFASVQGTVFCTSPTNVSQECGVIYPASCVLMCHVLPLVLL